MIMKGTIMYIKPINKNLVDIFLDSDLGITGFEPNCWLRLHKNREGKWTQVSGIRVPGFKFSAILKELSTKEV